MAAKEKSTELSLTHIPKRSLDDILHYLVLQKIQQEQHRELPTPFYRERHRFFLFQYHKNFNLVQRLKGSALCLLQTQFAKKPKNPV